MSMHVMKEERLADDDDEHATRTPLCAGYRLAICAGFEAGAREWERAQRGERWAWRGGSAVEVALAQKWSGAGMSRKRKPHGPEVAPHTDAGLVILPSVELFGSEAHQLFRDSPVLL
jgi:hypothetical protein